MSETVEAGRGAVSSPHWLASEEGARILAAGGSAMDAAIATNAMLGVVYPHMCGVGGDMFMLYYEASSGEVHCLNATGPAPRAATREEFLRRGLTAVPARGPLSVSVPGTVAGWDVASRRFGRLGLEALLSGAADVAEAGYRVSPGLARWIKSSAPEIAEGSPLQRMLSLGGEWLGEGDTVTQPELAATLRAISTQGRDGFYRGAVGEAIASAMKRSGGLITAADLAEFEPEWVEPITHVIDGYQLFVPPPNSQAVTALLMLQYFREAGGSAADERDARYYERLVEAKRRAFAFRDSHVGDPRFHPQTVEDALAVLRTGAAQSAPAPAMAGYPPSGDTVGFVTRDGSGNMCAAIQSLYYGFGSMFMPEGTGVILHNRGHYFSLVPGRVNSLEPGKRTMHTLMCAIGLVDGHARFAVSSMGADGQAQFVFQVFQELFAGATAQAATSAPRVLHGRFTLDDDPDVLRVEPLADPTIVRDLVDRGLTVRELPEPSETMGHAQAIAVRGDRVEAGFDPRSDGSAVLV
ncbi:gamma-glutamyltransferase [Microbacterium sp. MEC084]|nr:gamma-glutamyltransferase [Microbacterium sp. MEC084]